MWAKNKINEKAQITIQCDKSSEKDEAVLQHVSLLYSLRIMEW